MIVFPRFIAVAFFAFAIALSSAHAAYESDTKATRVTPSEAYYSNAVRAGAGLAFLGDVESLRRLAGEVERYEHEAADGDFRIADDLLGLAAMVESGRIERLDSLREAAEDADQPLRDTLERAVADDPIVQTRRLGNQRWWNGFARATNYLTQSASSLLTGNTQTVLYFAVDLINLWRLPFQYSPAQRKIRTLYRQFLEQFPAAPEAGWAQKRLSKLDGKHEREIALDLVTLSQLHLQANMNPEALFFAQKADSMGMDAHKTKLAAIQSDKRLERGRMTSLIVNISAEGGLEGEEAERYRAMLVSLAAGDESALESRARDYLLLYPQSPLAAEARYIRSVAAGMSGDPNRAREWAAKAASRGRNSSIGAHAGNVAHSPFSNPEAGLKSEDAQVARNTRAYVFLNSRSPEARIGKIVRGGPVRSERILNWLSPLFVIDVAVRAVKCAFGAGVSNEPVRDAAARMIEGAPNHPRAPQLAEWLGDEAAGRKDYSAARRYYETSGIVSEKKFGKLRNKQARSPIIRAKQIDNPVQREKFLQDSTDLWSGTKYAGKANKLIEKSRREQAIVLDKKQLARHPGLWSKKGLRLPAALLDGDKKNGELDASGVTLFPPDYQEAEYRVRENGQTEAKRINLQDAAREEILAYLFEKRIREERTLAADSATPKIPLELHGSFGPSGLLVYPTLIPRRMPKEEVPLYR